MNAYSSIIDSMSAKYAVDSNLVKAIVYVENLQGWYDIFPGLFGANDTVRPMNINPEIWGDLLPGRDIVNDASANIEAGVILIARIAERLENPTPEDIATMYNSLAKDATSEYGLQVDSVMELEAWSLSEEEVLSEFRKFSEHCFLAGTSVMMSDGSSKSVEEIKAGDFVMAFGSRTTAEGLVSARVRQTFTNKSNEVINFHGLYTTEGHLFLSKDNVFKTIISILEDDDCVLMFDGVVVRARTGANYGSCQDKVAKIGFLSDSGEKHILRIRAGVPYGRAAIDGQVFTLGAKMAREGYTLSESGLFSNSMGDVCIAEWPWGDPREHPLAREYVVGEPWSVMPPPQEPVNQPQPFRDPCQGRQVAVLTSDFA